MNTSKEWQNAKQEKSPYKVPDGYFEDFTNRMIDKISSSPKKKSKEKGKWIYYSLSSIAASLVIIFSGIHFSNSKQNVINLSDKTPNLPNEVIADNNIDFAYDYLMLDAEKIYEYETEDE